MDVRAKCPFRFRKCNRDCALRVKTCSYIHRNNSTVEGYTCALAIKATTFSDVSVIPRFVSDTKWKDCEDAPKLIETGQNMNGSDMPVWECSECGYDENICNASYCGGCGVKFETEN